MTKQNHLDWVKTNGYWTAPFMGGRWRCEIHDMKDGFEWELYQVVLTREQTESGCSPVYEFSDDVFATLEQAKNAAQEYCGHLLSEDLIQVK